MRIRINFCADTSPGMMNQHLRYTLSPPTLPVVRTGVRKALLEEGNAHSNGWARRCGQDHNPVQAEGTNICISNQDLHLSSLY